MYEIFAQKKNNNYKTTCGKMLSKPKYHEYIYI